MYIFFVIGLHLFLHLGTVSHSTRTLFEMLRSKNVDGFSNRTFTYMHNVLILFTIIVIRLEGCPLLQFSYKLE